MFEINTYLERESIDHADPYFLQNPIEKYIDIDDSLNIREIIDHKNFTPEHIQQLITIKFNQQFIVGFNVPSGLSLWEDTFIPGLESFINEGNKEIMYGLDPIILKFESVNSKQVLFSIYEELIPEEIYAASIVPEKEFIESLLNGASHYWQKLIEYKVFKENELRETTSKDLPFIMLKRIEELRRKNNDSL